jgi:hypothetical protein
MLAEGLRMEFVGWVDGKVKGGISAASCRKGSEKRVENFRFVIDNVAGTSGERLLVFEVAIWVAVEPTEENEI